MPEISGYKGYLCMARHFDKREISGIRDRTGQGYRSCKDTFSLYKGDNFIHLIFRERKFVSFEHIVIFRKYPGIKDEYNIAVDNEVKDPGRGTVG